MKTFRILLVILISSFLFSTSCNPRIAINTDIEAFVASVTNFMISPISDTSIVTTGKYGFNEDYLPKEIYLRETHAALNTSSSIPRYSVVTKREWRPEGYYFELSDGHAICFHDSTSLAYMLIEDGIVLNTAEYKIDSVLTRDLSDPNLFNFKDIDSYKNNGSVHGNIKNVKERDFDYVHKFGDYVKETNSTTDYNYDENGRLLSFCKQSGNRSYMYKYQKDIVYKYNNDGSYTKHEIRRDESASHSFKVVYNTLGLYDTLGRIINENDKETSKSHKYEYVKSTNDGKIQTDVLLNGKLHQRVIKKILEDGSYYENTYDSNGSERSSSYFSANGLLLSKYSPFYIKENYKIKYDEFNQLNVLRSGKQGGALKLTGIIISFNGLSRYDYYGNLIEDIYIQDYYNVDKRHKIFTCWKKYEYTYDSSGNWITTRIDDRSREDQYTDEASYKFWIDNYINDYSFRSNNLDGFSWLTEHYERDIVYY